jgi:hypothetical protein
VYRAIRRQLVEHPGEFLWPPRDMLPAAVVGQDAR